jgi:LAO/AO transport system kinase
MKNKNDFEEIIQGIENKSIKHLSKAITISESKKKVDSKLNEQIIDYFYKKIYKSNNKYNHNCKKIGITGAPGVGKSTFIETFGLSLCEKGHKVAVLAIDPSSSLTKGSILGDKTRMYELSIHENSFIRPSPTSGTLGGVNAKTREAILLCEAAGFDYVIIETVGVGQSEIEVRDLTDFFILLVLPNGGDDLQGIKKGIVEMSDLILINKADGANLNQAKLTLSEYSSILSMLKNTESNWNRKINKCSALEKNNFDYIFATIDEYYQDSNIINYLNKMQNRHYLEWARAIYLNKLIDNANEFWDKNINLIDNSNLSENSYKSNTTTPIQLSNIVIELYLKDK